MRVLVDGVPIADLLAPGVPEWLGADGVRVGWAVRDRLFLMHGDDVRMVLLPDLAEEVSPHPDGWVVALGQGFVTVDPSTGQLSALALDESADPVETRAGRDLGLYVEAPAHRMVRLADGATIPLPDGASRAQLLRPWSRGVGAVWVDGGAVYRLGTTLSVIGRVNGADALAVGPFGAVLVSDPHTTMVAAPATLGVAVGRRLDAETARFSADGQWVLATDDAGVCLVCCATGVITESWPGDLIPVGWGPGPLVLDGPAGVVRAVGGTVVVAGVSGSLVGFAGRTLTGPGGRAWNLDTAAPFAGPWTDGVTATDGTVVVWVEPGRAHVHGGLSFAVHIGDADDPLDHATLADGVLTLVTVDGEAARYDVITGNRTARLHLRIAPRRRIHPLDIVLSADGDDSEVRCSETSWPLPADGAARGAGLYTWTNEGMLCRIADVQVGALSKP